MTSNRSFLRWFFPAALLYAVGFAVATLYDLPINLAVYHPHSLYGAVMEAFGWYPAFLPPVLLAFLYLTPSCGTRLWVRAASGMVAVSGIAILSTVSMRYLTTRGRVSGVSDPRFWFWAGLMVIFWLIFFLFVTRVSAPNRTKLSFFAATGCLFLIAGQVIIYTVKAVWGRPRFDDMISLGSLENFQPWFLPFGPGGSSFPSGHTANAAGILILLVLCDLFPSWGRHRRLVLAGCWGYIAAMAISRVLIGRHFLSDTLAASAIMGLIFYAIHRHALYRRRLQLTLTKTAAPPQGDQ